ncbi:uncharacterized protein LOC112847887 isoform X3 [Oreochromis niloticus]|uniref:uncharacterized protein LOC112847887 isoform X3 n=1 Tax=Oreochromis niloticus TaxID=8128 RepID=UPI000DF315B9|nr:uncharacterized protein LOC112847887 isoform X3 [Oreochromis niloticus]
MQCAKVTWSVNLYRALERDVTGATPRPAMTVGQTKHTEASAMVRTYCVVGCNADQQEEKSLTEQQRNIFSHLDSAESLQRKQ